MRSHELRPTYENLRDCLLKDSIGRNEDLFAFVRILNGLEGSHAVALDGGWGSGKTFFVRQAKLLLDAGNEKAACWPGDVGERYDLNQKRRSAIPDDKMPSRVTVYYDAWENDTDDDPICSLVYSILQDVDSAFDLKERPDCITAAASVLEVTSGRNVAQMVETLRGKDPLASIRASRDVAAKIKDLFHALLEGRGDQLVIFVDELDRCRPSFAVKLLERIKHYFDDDRITFVFSVNISELQCTVRKFYGEDFDACRYLDRFFTMRLPMPPVDMEKYLEQIGFEHSTHYSEAVEQAFIRNYGLNLREIERYLRQCTDRLAPLLYSGKDSHRATPEDTGNEFALTFIFPILEGLYLFDKATYDQVLAGKNSQPVVELLAQLPPDHFNCLLDANESFSEVRAMGTSGKHHVVLRDRLEDVYQAIFVKPFLPGAPSWSICGQCQFGRSTYEFLQRLMSPLQQHAPAKDTPTEKAPALTP